MVRATDPLRRATVLTAGMALLYAVLLLPGSRQTPGYDPLIDGWLNHLVDAGVVVVLVLRAAVDRRERAAWALLAAGLGVALPASIAYYAHYQHLATVPSPSWSDLGWLGFYPLLYAGLVLLLRARVPRLLRSLWLDGLLAGLTAAALAVAILDGAAVPSETVGLAVAYPVADLLLLAFGAAALAVLGRSADLGWWLLCAAFSCFAITDAVYAARVAEQAYVVGGPLDLGWLLARLCLVGAAWASLRVRGARRPVHADGVGVLALPGLCATAVLLLLFSGTRSPLPSGAALLALAAGAVVVVRIAMTFREVRDLAEARRQARTDELTGLGNRRLFYDVLGPARQDSRHLPCAVLLLDLDRFKEVNDSLGHRTGDELLCLVGRRLSALLRCGDVAARLGGDEFAVLVTGVSGEQGRQLAQRIREDLQRPFVLGAATVTIDASIGVAAGPEHARTASELLQMADLAMYAAKAQRRGVLLYDEARDEAGLRRLELVAQLRQGIPDGQLVLHYQPQLDLRRGRVIGVEALARWQHPDRGLLGPESFIDLAESSGLMGLLTAAVLDTALGQCRRWRADGLDLRIAVNVSPSALVDDGFPAQVEGLLAGHGLPGSALVLEVTEELLMDSRDRAVGVLARLRDRGIGVSIDDYGTGYSSLAYLKDLPVTELKLDRSFVASMTASSRSAAIVHSTVELAHALDLELVAEGVEDAATLALLRAAGCDIVQGYLLGRPVPAEAVPGLVVGTAPVAAARSDARRPPVRSAG